MSELMLCRHHKTKWKLVFTAIDMSKRNGGHKQWLEHKKCCVKCGCISKEEC